jgi:hypothetical protein
MPRAPKITAEQVAALLLELKNLREEVERLKNPPAKAAAPPPPAAGKWKDATPEKKKELLKENWQENKDIYNANKRAKRAAMRAAAKVAAAPAAAPAAESSDEEEVVVPAPAPPPPAKKAKKGKPAAAEPVPAEPPRLREIYGTSVACPEDKDTWVSKHTLKWDKLSEITKEQYLINSRSALIKVGYAPPKTTDPEVIVDYAMAENFDVWKVITETTDPKYGVSTRNNFAKALLGVFNHKIRTLPEGHADMHRLCVLATIFHLSNAKAKDDTNENHDLQGQSALAAANTVEWDEWKTKSAAYIAAADNSFKAQQNAMIVAVYSMIPPVRRNWFNMEVVKTAPAKDDRRNCILIKPNEIVVYWGDFKNWRSFEKDPLRLPIESAELATLVRKYAATLKTKWFFPRTNTAEANNLTRETFGRRIGDITNGFVGKRFTPNRMRASFITNWHKNNATRAVNVPAMRAVMRQLHQTNIAVHLGYSKVKAAWNKAVAGIMAEAEKSDG